jgi:hypothetical protein
MVLSIEGFSDVAASIATGWSDNCRVGFAPTEDRHLITAHQTNTPNKSAFMQTNTPNKSAFMQTNTPTNRADWMPAPLPGIVGELAPGRHNV